MNKTNSDNGNYCVIYCRVSTKEQEEKGLSLDAQESLLRNWSKDNNFLPVETFRVHESATKSDRKGLRKMFKYCDENSIRNVLIEKSDRLNRGVDEIEMLIKKYRRNGFKFFLVKQNEILDSNFGANPTLIQDVRKAIDKYVAKNISEETLKGIKGRLEKGGYPGLPPIGYKAIPKTKKKEAQIVQTDDALAVKRFLETFSEGKYSVHQAVRLAKDMGLNLSRPQLGKLIKRRFYFGEFVWTHVDINGGEQKVFQNQTMGFEPLISKKTWEKNQEILKNNQKNFQKEKLAFKYNNLMTCGKCGRKIYGACFDHNIEWETKNGQKVKKYRYNPYYLCTKGPYVDENGEEKRCATPSFKEKELEQMLTDEIGLIKFNAKHWKEVKETLFKDETKDLINTEIKMLRTEQTKNENALDKMYSDFCDEIINAEFFKTRSEKIRDRQLEIRDRLAELEDEKEHFDSRIGKSIETLDAMKNWSEILKKANDEKKNHLLRLLTIKISTVHNRVEKRGKVYEYKGLEFTYSPEVRELFEIGLLEADKKWHASHPSIKRTQKDSLVVEKNSMSAAPLRI